MYFLIVFVSIVALVQTAPPQHSNNEENDLIPVNILPTNYENRIKRSPLDFQDLRKEKNYRVEEPIFSFYPDNFDEEPIYDGSGMARVTPEPTTTKPTTEGGKHASCDYDPDKEMENVRSRIDTTNKRVSQIECEYNMWEYKFRVLEQNRKLNECEIAEAGRDNSGVNYGKPVVQGEFPHMGAVGWRRLITGEGNDYIFKCGCSLISPTFALSAAHCNASREDENTAFSRPEIVRFGNVYIGPNSQEHPGADDYGVNIKIDNIFVLGTFRYAQNTYKDIALLRLLEEVPLSVNIRPACLYVGTEDFKEYNITGWGITETGNSSDNLLLAQVQPTVRDVCEANYTEISGFSYLHHHQFCAENLVTKSDTCQGDSGGPIQVQKPMPTEIDREGVIYYVLGVTSAGKQCGVYPGIYMNVSDDNIMCWIEKRVWPESTSPSCVGNDFNGYTIY